VALDKIFTWQSSEARKAALSLKNSITRSEFVVSLVILENSSGVMLTGSLQKVGTDFVQAMNDIGDMISIYRVCEQKSPSANCSRKHLTWLKRF